jgi:hypothetical protein
VNYSTKSINNAPGLLSIFDEHNQILEQQVFENEKSKSTLTKFSTIREKVAKYIAEKYNQNDLAFSKINKSFCNDFHDFLTRNKKIAHNTAVTYVQMLGKIFRIAIQTKLINSDPSFFYNQTKKKKIAEYLSLKEVDAFQKAFQTNREQSLVKNLFLFSCFTGLSYEELKTISTDHIVEVADSTLWLFVSRSLSYGTRRIPILEETQEIIDIYED